MADETDELALGDNGVNFDRHALSQEAYPLKGLRARYVQVRVLATAGRVVTTGLQVRGRAGTRAERTKP